MIGDDLAQAQQGLASLIREIDELKARLRKAEERYGVDKRAYCNKLGLTFMRDEQLRRDVMPEETKGEAA